MLLREKSDGSIKKFKAQLVNKGFPQLAWWTRLHRDIRSCYILSHPDSHNSCTIYYDWPLRQLELSNAFLHSSLEEEIFMKQPPMFHKYVYKLIK